MKREDDVTHHASVQVLFSHLKTNPSFWSQNVTQPEAIPQTSSFKLFSTLNELQKPESALYTWKHTYSLKPDVHLETVLWRFIKKFYNHYRRTKATLTSPGRTEHMLLEVCCSPPNLQTA